MTLTWTRAHAWIRRIEGGYTDNAADPGGATYAGVTLRTVQGDLEFDLDGDGDVDAQDIRALAGHPAKVEAFYRTRFWDIVHGDELPPHLALFAFDSAVHHGPRAGVVLLQRGIGLRPDGIVGPETLGKAQHAWNSGLEDCLVERAELFAKIHAARPASIVFRRGWSRRLFALQQEALFLTRDISGGRSN